MNQRPSRVPSPPAETIYAEHEDATFNEVERPNSVPAIKDRLPETEMPVADIMSVRDEHVTHEPIKNVGNLVAGIAGVMAEIKPVEKGGWNRFHNYSFARIQDLLAELTPLMGKHGIVIFQTEEGRELFDGGKVVAVRYRFTVVHKSGEVWPDRPLQTGLSNCRDTKGGFDDKALNKCHTAARKYFLLSLFQIPTDDMEDADTQHNSGAQSRERPQGQPRRQVPSPDGKIKPHLIPIIDQEAPVDWAIRFGAAVAKATTTEEIDRWYNENAQIFDKLKDRFAQVYNDAIDHMDACAAKLAAPKSDKAADPISTGKPAAPESDFPGDRKLADDGLDIPPALDRRTKAGDPPKTFDVEAWLGELEVAYKECTDSEELAEAQKSVMFPAQGSVTKAEWQRAMKLTKEHLDRVQTVTG